MSLAVRRGRGRRRRAGRDDLPDAADATTLHDGHSRQAPDDPRRSPRPSTSRPGVNNNGPNGRPSSRAPSRSRTSSWSTASSSRTTSANTPNNLFIEDAIQETTTSTSGISAEYGRFAGGVINTITKSGGNTFSGSFRDEPHERHAGLDDRLRLPVDGLNPEVKVDKIIPTYEATIGGPILKDKIWFFAAGRLRDVRDQREHRRPRQRHPYTLTDDETRYEGKLTFTPFQSTPSLGSYHRRSTDDQGNNCLRGTIYDLASLYNRAAPAGAALASTTTGSSPTTSSSRRSTPQRKFAFDELRARSTPT